MSRILLLLLVSLVALSGCTTTAKTNLAYRPTTVTPTNDDTDRIYMAKVERYATLRGINLVWVHPPRAKRYKD